MRGWDRPKMVIMGSKDILKNEPKILKNSDHKAIHKISFQTIICQS